MLTRELMLSDEAIVIEAPGASDDEHYIRGISRPARPLDSFFISHLEPVKGGMLRYLLSEKPKTK